MTQVYPIRLIRLMTGEMLMAGISDGGKLSYVLECPMVLIAVTSPRQKDNQIQEVAVMLKNWIEFTADEYYIISKKAVMCIMKPTREILADYIQAKIHSDIMGDLIDSGLSEGKSINDLSDEEDSEDENSEDGVSDPSWDDEEYDEFPGWGGDPRL